jgi:hypothetical protein
MFIDLHVKYTLFLSDFNKTWFFFDKFSKNTQISNFIKIRTMATEFFFPFGREDADRRTDMTKLIVAFRNIANASKSDSFNRERIQQGSLLQSKPHATLTHFLSSLYSAFWEKKHCNNHFSLDSSQRRQKLGYFLGTGLYPAVIISKNITRTFSFLCTIGVKHWHIYLYSNKFYFFIHLWFSLWLWQQLQAIKYERLQ